MQWKLAGCLLKPAINIKCCSMLRIREEMISPRSTVMGWGWDSAVGWWGWLPAPSHRGVTSVPARSCSPWDELAGAHIAKDWLECGLPIRWVFVR